MKLFHKHTWLVISAQQFFRLGIEIGEGEPITEVLRKCTGCDEISTKTISGHWTIEEIKNGDT